LITTLSFNSQIFPIKGNLKVVVNNISSSKGQIGFYLFNSSTGFSNHPENAILIAFVKTKGISTEYAFTNIEMGTYVDITHHSIPTITEQSIPLISRQSIPVQSWFVL
jgi:uncharacterized protein (DUF2141 family)